MTINSDALETIKYHTKQFKYIPNCYSYKIFIEHSLVKYTFK